MEFRLEHTDATSQARAGLVKTAHGEIQTPIFMPVGTVGSVKGVSPRDLVEDVRAQIILGNTYHLFLRPGMEVLEDAGGLHAFSGWSGPLLTDSGGFQVYSLADRRKLTEDGVEFSSHLDGSRHLFTPENVVDTQRQIGSDIMMVLDECPAADVTETYARTSNEMTVRWAKRCQDRLNETQPLYGFDQTLFAIVQGVTFPEIRRESARALVDLDFEGYAVGGLSVGEEADQMYDIVSVCTEILPPEKPRYLMGVGTPANLLENIARGIDMFDCVMPTRNGRNGMLFTTEGVINIRNKKWQKDHSPIDPVLVERTGRGYSKAYLRHLHLSNEILGLQIASVQNLGMYVWLMEEARAAIQEDRYASWMAPVIERVSRRL